MSSLIPVAKLPPIPIDAYNEAQDHELNSPNGYLVETTPSGDISEAEGLHN